MKFRLFKTQIDVAYTLICLAAIAVVLGVARGFLCCAAAIVIHESGHLAAMCRYGYFPDRIKISLFEIAISDPSRSIRRDRENFFIIFFGPFFNFICVLGFYLLYLKGGTVFGRLAQANLSVGLLNSLPVITLDGGQLVRLLVARRFGEQAAQRTLFALTLIILFPLGLLGFLVLFRSRGNFSLLFVCVYLVLSLLSRSGFE